MKRVTCTVPQAKHLKKLGWNKETEVCYFQGKRITYKNMEFKTPKQWQSVLFMPTAQELLEEIPGKIDDDFLVIEKINKRYRVSYINEDKMRYCTSNNLARALADQYILLKENKWIEDPEDYKEPYSWAPSFYNVCKGLLIAALALVLIYFVLFTAIQYNTHATFRESINNGYNKVIDKIIEKPESTGFIMYNKDDV